MATIETREVTFFGKTYHLPFGVVDSADKDYIATVEQSLAHYRAGLLTDYEMLEQLLMSHALWCSI